MAAPPAPPPPPFFRNRPDYGGLEISNSPIRPHGPKRPLGYYQDTPRMPPPEPLYATNVEAFRFEVYLYRNWPTRN